MIDKCVRYYDVDGFCIHDDWGSQRAPFFSEAAARDIILPEMKRFTEHVYSYGKFVELHSCGHVEGGGQGLCVPLHKTGQAGGFFNI